MTVTELIGHLQALELSGNGNDEVIIVDNDAGRLYKVSGVVYNPVEDNVEIIID